MNAFGSSAEGDCIVEDVCFTPVPTISPNGQPDETPPPSSGSTPEPTESTPEPTFDPTESTPEPTLDPTPPPTVCICEEQQFYFDTTADACVRVVCGETAPSDDVSLFDTSGQCCTNAFEENAEDQCVVVDGCFPDPTPSPTPAPSEPPVETNEPTSGSTPTVSTEATAPPTGAPRPKPISTISSSD